MKLPPPPTLPVEGLQRGREIIGHLDVLARDLALVSLRAPVAAVVEVARIAGAVRAVATALPEPDPQLLLSTAQAWREVSRSWEVAIRDVARTAELTPPTVWAGPTGDASRASLQALIARMSTVAKAAAEVAQALEAAVPDLQAARTRHTQAWDQLRDARPLTLGDLVGSQLFARVRAVRQGVSTGVRELRGAYDDAQSAAMSASALIRRAIDRIDLPSAVPPGFGVIEATNRFSGARNDQGPLRPGVSDRARATLARMEEAERTAYEEVLASVGPDARAWVVAGIAAGAPLTDLRTYAGHVAALSPEDLRDLDPLRHQGVFVQPNGTTCGSASLVMAKMINDPLYAMTVLTGYDPVSDRWLPDTSGASRRQAQRHRFTQEALRMHELTNGSIAHDGRFNRWWPQALGTTPAAVARQMSGVGGQSGVEGAAYATQWVGPGTQAASFDRIMDAVDSGHAVPLYVYGIDEQLGDTGNRATGAHVTLVTGTSDGRLTVYEPGSGRTRVVTRDDYREDVLQADLGWNRPMVAVVPRDR